MKINWGLGPPKPDTSKPDVEAGHEPDDAPPSEQHGWTAGANLTTKAVVALLWVAVAAGPLALIMQMLSGPQVQLVNQGDVSASEQSAGEAAVVGGFAERAVVAWLETSSDDAELLVEFFGPIEQRRPEIPWVAENPGVADIERLDDGLWSVVVTVEVTAGEPDDETEAPVEPNEPEPSPSADADEKIVEPLTGQRLYFQLPVLYVDGAMVAQALPAAVAGPQSLEPIETAHNEELPADHPAIDRITNFLTHLLVSGDQSELDTYSAPGSEFVAITPSPYASIEVADVRSAAKRTNQNAGVEEGDILDVLVAVEIVDANGQTLQSQYALTLRTRADRWEVSAIHETPALAASLPVPQPSNGSLTDSRGQTSDPP